MRINGKVIENAIIDNQTSKYRIENKDGIYVVKAIGKEAVKDYLFIREGQMQNRQVRRCILIVMDLMASLYILHGNQPQHLQMYHLQR